MVFGMHDKDNSKDLDKNQNTSSKSEHNLNESNKTQKENLSKDGQKELSEKENYEIKIKELTETLQRLQAEFENSSKRSQKQNAEFREFATASLIEQLLPVLDTLEQGVKHNKEFILIYEQLSQILKKSGLEKIQVHEGKEFDHDTMECLMQEESENVKEGKVAKVLLNGYKLNHKILRLTKVSVSVGKKKEEQDKKETEADNKKLEKN